MKGSRSNPCFFTRRMRRKSPAPLHPRIRDISDDESTQAVMETSVISSSEFLFSVLGLGERYGREITLTKASFYRLDGSEVYTLLFGVEST